MANLKNAWIIHVRMGGSVVIVHERCKIDFTVSKAAHGTRYAPIEGARDTRKYIDKLLLPSSTMNKRPIKKFAAQPSVTFPRQLSPIAKGEPLCCTRPARLSIRLLPLFVVQAEARRAGFCKNTSASIACEKLMN